LSTSLRSGQWLEGTVFELLATLLCKGCLLLLLAAIEKTPAIVGVQIQTGEHILGALATLAKRPRQRRDLWTMSALAELLEVTRTQVRRAAAGEETLRCECP